MLDQYDFVLWGSAGHAKVLAEAIHLRGGRVTALFDNQEVPSVLKGVPVYCGRAGFDDWKQSYQYFDAVAGLVAIGGSRGRDRLAIQRLFQQCGITSPVLIHPSAVVSSTVVIGAGSQVLALANIAADTRVGEGCIINHRATVDHECHLGNGVHIAPGATLCGCVRLGDNVFIGAGAVVLPRIFIEDDAIIGAGAVVTRDVTAGTVVVGNPAKQFTTN